MSSEPAAPPSRPSSGAAGARLGELYTAHARMVHGICRLMLREVSDAEDATQQVFLLAYRSLLTGTAVEKGGAWLGTIARNECRARIEARMRTPLPTDQLEALISPGVEEQAEGRANAAALYAELAVLPRKQREAVVLRDLYGLRYDEVATALGTSRAAVEALLFRGRRRLQHRLRPRLAAGVLVVPLALHESLASAVPGFAGAAAPAGAFVATPLLAKLAAGGAAVVLAGSAGVIAERGAHDRPPTPAPVTELAPELAVVEEAPRPPAENSPASHARDGIPLVDDGDDNGDPTPQSGAGLLGGSEEGPTALTSRGGERESGGSGETENVTEDERAHESISAVEPEPEDRSGTDRESHDGGDGDSSDSSDGSGDGSRRGESADD